MGKLLDIMLHPRRTLRSMKAREQHIAGLEHQIDALRKQIVRLEAGAERQHTFLERRARQAEGLLQLKEEQLNHAITTRDRAIHELESTQRQLAGARRELDEYSGMEAKLEQLDAMMERIEEMRRNYERRIAGLREQLAEAQRAPRRLRIPPSKRYTPPPSSLPKTHSSAPEESDWLKDLPEQLR